MAESFLSDLANTRRRPSLPVGKEVLPDLSPIPSPSSPARDAVPILHAASNPRFPSLSWRRRGLMRGLECPCSNPGCVTGRGGGARYWALEGGWVGREHHTC